METPKAKVADTVGAGDCFLGVLITSLLQGENLEEAHGKAVNTAAYICSFPGSWITHNSI